MKEVNPKVSVIVPVWNPGPSIRRCLESLRSQTLEDIEIIFVDDCGTDGAMDVVRAAAAEDPRIRIITNAENIGAGASRNAGIEAARGEYLSFVDADDYVDTGFMEILYRKGKAEDMDIVKGTCINEFEEGAAISIPYNLNDSIQRGLKDGEPLFLLFHYEHQAALYHRRLFVNPDVRYGLTRNAQDTTFLLKACHAAKSFGIDERASYHYVCRKSSAVHSFSGESLEARISALRDRAEYLASHVEPNPYAVQYIIRSLKGYLSLQEHVVKVGMEKEAAQFLAGLRAIAIEYPNIKVAKDNDMTVLALVDYGESLAEWPYSTPWGTPSVEDYLDFFAKWVGFLTARHEHIYMRCCKKTIVLAERIEEMMKKEGKSSVEIKEQLKAKVNTLWHRPSVLWMRFRIWQRKSKHWRILRKVKQRFA